MKNTRGFVVPLLLAIIGLLFIGGGVYVYSQKTKAPAVVNNEVATSSPMTISGEYDYSDMSGIAAFVVPGSSGSRTKEYNFGDAEIRFNQKAQTQIVGSLSPFSDSCNLGIEATLEIKDPKLVKVDEKRNVEMYQATFVRLISKGKVYDNCAGDGGVVTKTERKSASNTETSASVPGMSIYTDTLFGFSFWYPSTMTVSTVTTRSNAEWMYGPGTQVLQTISAPDFTVDEVYSPTMSILSSVDAGCCGSPDNKYFFDPSIHTWMEYSDGGSSGKGVAGTFAADVSKNTMGGLHIFQGYTRFGNKVIIPLSATHFLALYSKCNDATDYGCSGTAGKAKFEKSLQTILATDPSVATPLSLTLQVQTIQAEKDAYAAQ